MRKIPFAGVELTSQRVRGLRGTSRLPGRPAVYFVIILVPFSLSFLKKNQSTPRPSEHPPVMGGKMSKRLGGIKACKYKTSSWHSNRFPDADNIGSAV